MTSEQNIRFARRTATVLAVILCFKIAGYFTVHESIVITRAIKILLRVSMTGWLILVYRSMVQRGNPPGFASHHLLSPWLYSVYLFLGLASLLYSTNPGYSLLQLTMNLESFVFSWLFIRTCLMLRHYYPERPLRFSRLFTTSVFAIMAVFIIGMYVSPDEFYRLTHGGEEARLGGYLMNPNELGMLAVVGLGSCLMELYQGQRKLPLIFMGAVMLLALVMTGSRSSMISFLAIVFFFITKSKYNWLKPALFAGGFLAIPVIVNTIFIKQGDLEEVLSMTGRLPFWTALLTEGLPKEPWMGYGYMRIAWTEMFQSVNTYAGKMTHNTFIQVLMNLGFIGFGTVLAQLTATLRGWIRNPNKLDRMFFLAVFIPILVNSFTEFGIFGEANFGILFYQILIFLVVLRPGERLTAVQRMQLQRLRPEFTLKHQPI